MRTAGSSWRSRAGSAITSISAIFPRSTVEATRHYEEPALAALIIAIATVNLWNRLNASTRQVAGAWAG